MRLSVVIAASLFLTAAAPADGKRFRAITQATQRLEPVRETWRLIQPLSLVTPAGSERLASGTTVHVTRRLVQRFGTYALVASERGEPLGLAAVPALTASARKAALTTPYLDALTTIAREEPGKRRKGARRAYAENAGLKTGVPGGIAVTADFCPTGARFEEELFERLDELGRTRRKPVPMTLFVSGRWLDGGGARRRAEVARLRHWHRQPGLALTFANHSYNHPYKHGARDQDFLLSRGVKLEDEILRTDLSLLRAGFLPAPFFRLPGLVGDDTLMKGAAKLGTIVTGAGSWPALGQRIRAGDVVLVHGNGGEPGGVRRLLAWLRGKADELKKGRLELFPVSEAVR